MNRLVIPITVLLGAAAAQATIPHRVVPVDNSDDRPTDFDYYTWDLRFDVPPWDDWTSAYIVADIEADELPNVTFNPRQERLRPPRVEGSPPAEWINRYGNMVSTPLDWPNTLDSRNSSLGTVVVSHSDGWMEATWFDTTTKFDVSFTAFRLTLRQRLGLSALTLEATEDLVARIEGKYIGRNFGGTLWPYKFNIYRIPEPSALALLGLGGLVALGFVARHRRRPVARSIGGKAMRKTLAGCVPVLFMALAASPARATIIHSVVPVDNSDGRPTDFDYYTWDLRFHLSGSDDWTTAGIVAEIEADELPNLTFNPRQDRLRPPRVEGSPPAEWINRYGNMVSTPLDWPNTLDSRNSSLATVEVSHSDGWMEAIWFDTTTNRDVSFTGFRLTLRQTAGLPALTLEDLSEDLVAVIEGKYSGWSQYLWPYRFEIYRVPEPGALPLLALGGLAGFSALARAIRRR